MAGKCGVSCDKVSRLKTLDKNLLSTPLNRCLSVLDMTFLGISYMIGPGIYVVTGTVVRYEAGPAAIFSYMFAGLAATLSSLCYAEFGSRIPLAGSAYTYTYVTVGEIWAFFVGWNMLLEYILAVATSAKAWSASLDALCGGAISRAMIGAFGLADNPIWSPYPDFVAVLAVIACMVLVATGAKTSITVNNVLSVCILVSIVVIIGAGFKEANVELWTNSTYGGFTPYGWSGVFKGAATCFYSYIGFDGIAVAGEEAINPKKALPWATGVSMATVTILYVLATASLTLMVPYNMINISAPFPYAFHQLGVTWAKYAVAVGSLIGITTSITGGMYFLPRVAYSMASDGLLFPIFGRIIERTQTPVFGIMILGSVACVLALVISLQTLVLLMSIGTLISFSFVASSVIIARNRVSFDDDSDNLVTPDANFDDSIDTREIPNDRDGDPDKQGANVKGKEDDPITQEPTWRERLGERLIIPGRSLFGLRELILNSKLVSSLGTDRFVILLVSASVLSMFISLILIIFETASLRQGAWWSVLILVVFLLTLVACAVALCVLPQHVYSNTFYVPCVPLIPLVSVFCNLAMMLLLGYLTWIRLAIWMALGSLVYIFYGYRHSRENHPSLLASKGVHTASYGSLFDSNSVEKTDS